MATTNIAITVCPHQERPADAAQTLLQQGASTATLAASSTFTSVDHGSSTAAPSQVPIVSSASTAAATAANVFTGGDANDSAWLAGGIAIGVAVSLILLAAVLLLLRYRRKKRQMAHRRIVSQEWEVEEDRAQADIEAAVRSPSPRYDMAEARVISPVAPISPVAASSLYSQPSFVSQAPTLPKGPAVRPKLSIVTTSEQVASTASTSLRGPLAEIERGRLGRAGSLGTFGRVVERDEGAVARSTFSPDTTRPSSPHTNTP